MKAKIVMSVIIPLLLILLLSSVGLAAPADKADKLKVNDQDWDREGQEFVISLSCQFGIATAGEHADFKANTHLSVTDENGNEVFSHDDNGWDITKAEGAEKDADGFIAIEPLTIGWDRDGGTFTGVVSVESSTTLVGPSGKPFGEPVVFTQGGVVVEEEPGTTEITAVCRGDICEFISPEQQIATITLTGPSAIHLESDFFSEFTSVTMAYDEGEVIHILNISPLCTIEQYQVGFMNHIVVHFDTTDLPVGPTTWANYTVQLNRPPPIPSGSKLEDSILVITNGGGSEPGKP